jgi:prevent-host-death family protein
MVQLTNVSQARKNLAKLLKQVNTTKKPVVIIQDSTPAAILYPYEEAIKKEEQKNQLFQLQFQQMYNEGEKAFKKYLKKNKLPTPQTEEEAYQIIKNA